MVPRRIVTQRVGLATVRLMVNASLYALDVGSVHPEIARFLDRINVTSLVRTDIEYHASGTVVVVLLTDAVDAQLLVRTVSDGVVLTLRGHAFEAWLFDEGGVSDATEPPDMADGSSGDQPSTPTTMLYQRWWVAGPAVALLIALLVVTGVVVAKRRRRQTHRLDTPEPGWTDSLKFHVTASYGDEESHLGDAAMATGGNLVSVLPDASAQEHTPSPITRATKVKVSPWAPNRTAPSVGSETGAGAEATEDDTPPGYAPTLEARQEEMVHIRRQLDLHFQTSPKKDRYYTHTDL